MNKPGNVIRVTGATDGVDQFADIPRQPSITSTPGTCGR
jgi:hypothetical protein